MQSRIEAALSAARNTAGADAPFSEVWAAAAEIDPAAFNAEGTATEPHRLVSKVKAADQEFHIEAALSNARAALGEAASFTSVWELARQRVPAAFT